MRINEILDAKVPFTIIENTAENWSAYTDIGEDRYWFICFIDGETGDWQVMFGVGPDQKHVSFALTNKNDPLQVGSFVKSAMATFVETKKPVSFQFKADSRVRLNVYLRVLRTILPNWNNEIVPIDGGFAARFTRKNASVKKIDLANVPVRRRKWG